MYNKNFVVAVKVGGKVLREVEDLVYLPFGAEYTILLKNTSTLKVKAKVSIDGQDATEDVHLVIYPGESTEVKRFIRKGNLEVGNAFKFIEKTAQIEAFRGNKAEDGLITVEYEFEKAYVPPVYTPHVYRDCWGGRLGGGYDQVFYNSVAGGMANNALGQALDSSSYSMTTSDSSEALSYGANSAEYSAEVKCSSGNLARSATRSLVPKNDAGITAPGQIVDQKFHTAAWFATDGVKHSMTLQLKGKTDNAKVVKQAVVVKKVQRCTMCGTNTKQTAKFCHQCGASVEIV